MQFSDLRLAEPILRAVASEGYTTATPVQAKAIPLIFEGRDVLGSAQTGTGKTAAFALPILHRLSQQSHGHTDHAHGPSRKARCLVLCPTRELATQIADGFRAYGKNLKLRLTVIFGGVGQNPQVNALRQGVDIVVATPGRLLDLMNQRLVDLSGIETLVLDEADRMLDMGFIHDIRRVCSHLPKKRQTLLFSATMPEEIRKLADSLMHNPATIFLAPASSPTADRIDQSVYFVEKKNKAELLAHLVNELPMFRTIVFTRTKRGADRVVRHLHKRGIKSEAIHGNKSQNARERALNNFRDSKISVLIATDVASRGIDIDNITHVVNYDITDEPETYVHRIGRTARAGASGAAIAFCDNDERSDLRAIEKMLGRSIPVKKNHPNYEARFEAAARERETDDEPETEESSHRHERPRAHKPAHKSHVHARQPSTPAGQRPAPHPHRQDTRHAQSHAHRQSSPQHATHRSTSSQHTTHRSAPSQPHTHRSAPKPHAQAHPQHRSAAPAHTGPKPHRKGGHVQGKHPLSRRGQQRRSPGGRHR